MVSYIPFVHLGFYDNHMLSGVISHKEEQYYLFQLSYIYICLQVRAIYVNKENSTTKFYSNFNSFRMNQIYFDKIY